jgi:ATP-dependent protease ClpP protease subunit
MPNNAYNIKMISGTNDAEINLYGEIVSSRPKDWWTGEPVEGFYVCLDEFIKDLNELKDKDNITVRINSVGGEVYAATAIRNRLRELKAKVTTINDSLAASAGTILLQAADKGCRKVKSASSLFVHRASMSMWGNYNIDDLNKFINGLQAAENVAVKMYSEMSGKSEEDMRAFMEEERWFTADEAVENGFADEVINDGEKINMSISKNREFMTLNGVRMQAIGMPKVLPSGMAITNETTPPGKPEDGKITGGTTEMPEIKTVDELRQNYPDLTAQIENAARQAGTNDERTRLSAIEDIAPAIGDPKLIKDAKYGDKPMNASELALAAMQKQAKIGSHALDALDDDGKNSNTENVTGEPAKDEKKPITTQERMQQGQNLAKDILNPKEDKK